LICQSATEEVTAILCISIAHLTNLKNASKPNLKVHEKDHPADATDPGNVIDLLENAIEREKENVTEIEKTIEINDTDDQEKDTENALDQDLALLAKDHVKENEKETEGGINPNDEVLLARENNMTDSFHHSPHSELVLCSFHLLIQ
jgi:hypothetical protein